MICAPLEHHEKRKIVRASRAPQLTWEGDVLHKATAKNRKMNKMHKMHKMQIEKGARREGILQYSDERVLPSKVPYPKYFEEAQPGTYPSPHGLLLSIVWWSARETAVMVTLFGGVLNRSAAANTAAVSSKRS